MIQQSLLNLRRHATRFLAFLFLTALGIGQMWAVDPDLSFTDFGSSDWANVVKTHDNGITISSSATGFGGNFSGHYYISSMNGGSNGYTTSYLGVSAPDNVTIDSISLFVVPNGTSETSVAWIGWGVETTPSNAVDDHGELPSFKSSKAYANAIWQTLNLSDKELKTIHFARQFKTNFTQNSTNLGQWGKNQTVNVLGIKVWLKAASDPTPSTSTVYYVDYYDWGSVHAYAWGEGDDNNNGSFPGVEMTQVEDVNVNGHAVYSYEYAVDATYTNVIFAQDGSNKTSDLTLNEGEYYYGEWDKGTWFPTVESMTGIYLTGEMNEWSQTEGAFVDGQLTVALEANTDYEFKIINNGIYYSVPAGNVMTKELANDIAWDFSSANQENVVLTTEYAGDYTFAYNGSTNQLTVTYPAARYAVNFAADGGTGTMAALEYVEGADVTVPACTFTAPTGKAFKNWTVAGVDGVTTAVAGDHFTMPAGVVTLTATWKNDLQPTTIFSMKTAASGNVSVDASADHIALPDAAKLTISGGSVVVSNGQTSAKNLVTSSGFSMTNGNTYFTVTLTGALQAGDIISATMSAASRGLKFSTNNAWSDSYPGGAAATTAFTYTVVEEDGICGETTFNVFRGTSNTTTFNNFTIARPNHGDIVNNEYAGVKIEGEAAVETTDYTKSENVITLVESYRVAPAVALVNHATYEDETTKDLTVDVEFAAEPVDNFFVGTATIGTTEYTVKVPVDNSTTYHVTYAKGDESVTGDLPTQDDMAEGDTFTLSDGTSLSREGYKLTHWYDGENYYFLGAEYTMPAKHVTLTAVWKQKVTVTLDMGTEGQANTTAVAIVGSGVLESITHVTSTSPVHKLLGYFTAADGGEMVIGADGKYPTTQTVAGWITVSGTPAKANWTRTEAGTLYAHWQKGADAESFDLEQFVLDNSKKGDYKSYLDSKNWFIKTSSGDELDSLVATGKTKGNYQFLGLKLKNNGSYLAAVIPAGTRVDVKIGNLGAAKVQLNEVDAATALVAGVAADSTLAHNYFDCLEETVLKIVSTGTSTTVIKGVDLTPIYSRANVQAGKFGTICLPYAVSEAAVTASGFTFYNIESKTVVDGSLKSIALAEQTSLEAGVPYLFEAPAGEGTTTLTLALSGDKVNAVTDKSGLVGTLTGGLEMPTVATNANAYFVSTNDNKLHRLTGTATATIGANKAYIDLTNVAPAVPAAPARIIYAADYVDQATGLDNLNANDMQKFMQDGKLYIRVADRIYDATGRLVK